mmetsp:Transcript_99395/g.306421  ORF Transcript_99395/g.306421 Transcript_99395/m.306421 type:complete len:231 (-) Transcript_99395:37-729(-)
MSCDSEVPPGPADSCSVLADIQVAPKPCADDAEKRRLGSAPAPCPSDCGNIAGLMPPCASSRHSLCSSPLDRSAGLKTNSRRRISASIPMRAPLLTASAGSPEDPAHSAALIASSLGEGISSHSLWPRSSASSPRSSFAGACLAADAELAEESSRQTKLSICWRHHASCCSSWSAVSSISPSSKSESDDPSPGAAAPDRLEAAHPVDRGARSPCAPRANTEDCTLLMNLY